jgi:hypothetical protein
MPAYHINVVAVFRNTDVGIEATQAAGLKAWAHDGTLYVSGLTAGKPLSVYNILGVLVYQGVADSDQAAILLP